MPSGFAKWHCQECCGLFVGTCHLAKFCQLACQAVSDECRSGSKKAKRQNEVERCANVGNAVGFLCRPILWDCKLKGYKDRKKRHDAFIEIAVSFGVEKDEIERKLKNLLCHLSREMKKEKDSIKSGGGTEEVYKSKWFAYESLLFLKDRNRPRGMTGTQDPLDIMTTEPNEIVQKVVGNDNDVSIQSTSTSQGKKRSLNYSRNQNKAKYSAIDEALAIMKYVQGCRSVKNQYTLFGEQVGIQISGLNTPYSKKVVRQIISTVLFDAEMGKYDYPPNTSTQLYPGAHLYSQPPNSCAPMCTHSGTPTSSNPSFRSPFSSTSQVSTPMMSPASFTDGPGTTVSSASDMDEPVTSDND
ncbi:hypothetical protein QTP88_003660 [Uroleucon formosanum]